MDHLKLVTVMFKYAMLDSPTLDSRSSRGDERIDRSRRGRSDGEFNDE